MPTDDASLEGQLAVLKCLGKSAVELVLTTRVFGT
jgi:hypothetical protein